MMVRLPARLSRIFISTSSLAGPVTWQTLSNGIIMEGALKVFTFTNNPAVTSQFFRLVYP